MKFWTVQYLMFISKKAALYLLEVLKIMKIQINGVMADLYKLTIIKQPWL